MKDKDDILNNARQLGYSITKSTEYQELIKAEEDYLNDIELEKAIEELESIKRIYNSAKNSSHHDINMYMEQIKKLEKFISNSSTVNNLKLSKVKYDNIFKNINNLIAHITNEEYRIKGNSEKKECSSCSGCSK